MAHSEIDQVDDWEEIHGFFSPGEFRRFQDCVKNSIENGVLVEVNVESPYSGSSLFDERWFESKNGSCWRLVAPDPPFRGVFERVETEPGET